DYSAIHTNIEEALVFIYQSYYESERIKDLKEHNAYITDKMKTLTNSPSKYKEQYDLVFELYSEYQEYISKVESPTGSYNSFTNDVKANGDSVIEIVNKLNIKLQ